MSPAANLDEKLLALQVELAKARAKHEDLCQRHSVLEKMHYYASATAMRVKRDKAFQEFKKASRDLAAYMSKRERR